MGALRRWLQVVVCLGALQAGPLAAEPVFNGSPPVTRLPVNLDVYPENFDVAQDAQSMLYVANSDGVLVYDGNRWSLVKLPNGEMARSLRFDGKDRVYVGGYGVFGYVSRDELGEEQFTDLTPQFAALLAKQSFADIWDIHIGPEGVFFRALKHLFLYSPAGAAPRLWRHEGRFGAMTRYRGETLLQFRGEGLRSLHGDQWQLLKGSEPLSELVY